MNADTPTLWRDMTDAEKGALLLAHHEGKTIEGWLYGDKWKVLSPEWDQHNAYRIKLEPKKPRECWVLFSSNCVPVGCTITKAQAMAAKWDSMIVVRMIPADD